MNAADADRSLDAERVIAAAQRARKALRAADRELTDALRGTLAATDAQPLTAVIDRARHLLHEESITLGMVRDRETGRQRRGE